MPEQIPSHFARLEMRVSTLETGLKENTEITNRIERNTSEILGIFESWKGAGRVLRMIGRMARPLGYILGVFSAIAALWASIKTGMHQP